MKAVRHVLGYLIAGSLLYFLIQPFGETHTALKDATFEIQWGWLICSFGAILFYWSAYLSPFATLLRGLTGKQVSFRDAFTLFHLANITRYLPGRIWGVVRLLSLSPRFGLSKTAVGSSLTLHVGIETAIGGLIALSLLFSTPMQDTATEVLEKVSGETLLVTLAVIGLLAGGLFLIPRRATDARTFLKSLAPLLKNVRLWVNVLTCHGLLWMCQGGRLLSLRPELHPCAVDRCWHSHRLLRVCVDCRLLEFSDTGRVRGAGGASRTLIRKRYARLTCNTRRTAVSGVDAKCGDDFGRGGVFTSQELL